MALTIKTNGHLRSFVNRCDVPEKILKTQFGYQDPDTCDGYFKYRNTWYHLDQVINLGIESDSTDNDLKGWHGVAGDSYFSGIVLWLSNNGEQYKIGSYYS